MAATVTLKIKLQDTVHRVLLQPPQVNYESVAETIKEIYPGEVIATYLNEEGDQRVLSAETFSSFLGPRGTEGGDAVLGLELSPVVPAGAEWAGPETAQALHTPEGSDNGKGDGKGAFKGKGKWKGKGKGKGKSKGEGTGGSRAEPDPSESGDVLRERWVAAGSEDLSGSLSSQLYLWSKWGSRWASWALKHSTGGCMGRGRCKGKGKGRCKGRRNGAPALPGTELACRGAAPEGPNGAVQPETDALSPNAAPEAAAAADDKAE